MRLCHLPLFTNGHMGTQKDAHVYKTHAYLYMCMIHTGASPVAQKVKNLPAVWETRVEPWVRSIPWKRKWQPTPVFLPGESHGRRSLAGYSPWGCRVKLLCSLIHSYSCQLGHFLLSPLFHLLSSLPLSPFFPSFLFYLPPLFKPFNSCVVITFCAFNFHFWCAAVHGVTKSQT